MARSGQDILTALFTNAISLEFVPNAFERGRIGLLYATLAAEFVGWEVTLDNYLKEGFLPTAVLSDDIIKLAEPLHYRTPALPSNVMIKFYWDPDAVSKQDQVIAFGQLVESSDNTPVQYMITERGVLYGTASAVWLNARSVSAGADTMVGPDYLTELSPPINNVMAINPEESWGGADAEDPNTVRTRAMGARYTFEKGTSASLDLELSKIGLQTNQYNLVENLFGSGSFAVYVDSQIDEFMDLIRDVVKDTKAGGIYAVCEKADIVPFVFSLAIRVVSDKDITPEERNNLKEDITNELINFVTLNGVGKKIVASHLVHDLLDKVIDKYQVFDIRVVPDNNSTRYDTDGNILVASNERLEIQDVTIEIGTA